MLGIAGGVMVKRHPLAMAPHAAADVCKNYGFKTKIINAGDGPNFHPTQAMLDIFTIKEHFGEKFDIETLNVAIGADITNARVAHSLIAALAQYRVRLFLIGKYDPWLPTKFLDPLFNNWIEFHRMKKLPESEKMDVIYWFRYQTEYGNEESRDEYNKEYGINQKILGQSLKPDGIFLHPGPRGGEIDNSID